MSSAEKVLEAHWDGRLPVDPVRIARQLGLNVVSDFMSDSGVIQRESSGDVVICYNASESAVRQRFTVAHEIGHYVLGHLKGSVKKFRDPSANFSTGSVSWEERDANKFAAELLMPENTVRFAITEKAIEDVEKLARLFQVSTVAMSYRLNKLGFVSA